MKGNHQHLLLVSDDQEFGQSLEQILHSNNGDEYDITCVFPLEKALDLLDEREFSLVVFDLPKETACSQVAERVRSAFGRLPVIMLSSSGYNQAISAIRQGIQQVMDKSRVDNEMMMTTIMASIERSRMENELRVRDEILEAVNYAAEVFLTQTNWDSRLGEILERLGRATESDRVYIYRNFQQPDGGLSARIFYEWCVSEVLPYSGCPEQSEFVYQDKGFGQWMEQLSKGEIIHGDQENLPPKNKKAIEHLSVQSFIVVPIFDNSQWWGLIGFEHSRKPKNWSEAETDAIKTSASMIGAAIGRQLAEEKMKYLATHDHLTGLPNRLLFADRFQQAVSHAARSGERIGVISLDMDKFKLINDTYGHPLGDQALIQVGNRLSGCLRTSDTCARIGGDEFGFIADGLKSEQDLDVVIQKLTQSLRSEFILEGKTFHISASMGASLFPEHGADLEELMSAADKALYQAKNTGSGYRVFRKGEQYSLLQE